MLKLHADVMQGGETKAEPLQMYVCVRVFQAIMLGEMWKTQSPPVSMETSSLSQAERQSPSTFRIRGVNYSTLFNAHVITLMLSTADNNILMKMKINTLWLYDAC